MLLPYFRESSTTGSTIAHCGHIMVVNGDIIAVATHGESMVGNHGYENHGAWGMHHD